MDISWHCNTGQHKVVFITECLVTIGEALLMFTFMIQPAFRISSAFLDVLSLASQLYFLTILIKIQLFFTNCLQWLLVVKLTVFVYLLQ